MRIKWKIFKREKTVHSEKLKWNVQNTSWKHIW